ncbi:MAG: tyrosine-protein phosphatase [Clostridia bacterium]|nr:tyrosine-protein phosphatase [Clostridia bacterium]
MNKLVKKSMAILLLLVMVLNLGACAPAESPAAKAETVQATVIEIEKYGHAVLDITTADFTDKGYALGDVVCVRFDSYESEMPFFDGYYSNPGTVMLRGMAPEENIALCINYGDFSVETGIALGDIVEITLAEKAEMLEFQKLCSLKYSNDRADYPDDVTFANFRAVTLGDIGDGKLYRTASPINNEHGRAAYANDLIASVNVTTVLNLADSVEDIEEYCAAEDFDSEYYRNLYEAGDVIALDMTANFFSEKFAQSLAEGLTFLAQNEPPYCVHCTEGKDRAGFTVMLLAALMGADLDAIIDDYMISFYNYFGIDKATQPERYKTVLENNLFAMLYHVMGVDTYDELKQVDLEAAATTYLLNAGMSEADILTLKNKLR